MTDFEKIRKTLDEADAVVIGAGAGLSTSAGFVYGGERFHTYFQDFIDKYNYRDEYTAGFMVQECPPEEYWAFWSRNIYLNRYMDPPKPVYDDLLKLVSDKDYFVLTTNVDHLFRKAGFEKERLFYTQGDYGLFQCSEPCHQKTYDNERIVREMLLAQGFTFVENGDLVLPADGTLSMTIPSDLIPTCPVCGKPMTLNLRVDDTFVQDDGWHKALNHFADFLSEHGETGSFGFVHVPGPAKGKKQQRIVYLELGVGMNTPGIIKYPFMQAVYRNPNATYICLNYKEAYTAREIADRSICIDGDIGERLTALNG